ncbi:MULTISPECIES: hypothetical protein [Legionella]|uniref:Microtubule-binding protein n=1 Tax=Legionella septentrionalis TaxID=2498109 RepID=A0A3S0XTY1_9GAMM|nr:MULTISPECIES: hypothetical protein [Legionella]MCP0914445.1 hypothetical protein [Legionella sp. 27cVA30]RUQ89491.1 hypothetical protein EKM59_03575 [Legionella septentrionalis]RUR10503.1 hypothetical protein ELY14_05200 [Legionella septentrionalis]RUR16123.1 hypothetical protein ELY10_04275 [Legionella septentrionalis]
MVQTVRPEIEVIAPVSLTDTEEVRWRIQDIKKHLDEVIDSIYHNSSILNGWANFWGEVPLWQKILTGIGFFGTLLILGIVGHLLPLIAVTVISAGIYGLSSYLLDEHYESSEMSKESLKQGVLGLVETLSIIIEQLQQIRIQLAEEIQHFKGENEKLQRSIDELSQQVQLLSQETKELLGIKNEFAQLKVKYEQTNERLESLKVEAAKQIGNLKEINHSFFKIAANLTESSLENKEHQEIFITQLKKFVEESTQESIKKAEEYNLLKQELEVAKKQLQENNSRYEALNGSHELLLKEYNEELKRVLKRDHKPTPQLLPFSFIAAARPLTMVKDEEEDPVYTPIL